MTFWRRLLRRLGLVTIRDYTDCRDALAYSAHFLLGEDDTFAHLKLGDWLDCRLHNATLLCDYGTITYESYNEFQQTWWELGPED